MTTEFVSVPADWTVEQTLDHIREVGRAKETVYAIYVLDPDDAAARARRVAARAACSADRDDAVLDGRQPPQAPRP